MKNPNVMRLGTSAARIASAAPLTHSPRDCIPDSRLNAGCFIGNDQDVFSIIALKVLGLVVAGGNVHIVMTGNPTVPSGAFYDAFTKERVALPLSVSHW